MEGLEELEKAQAEKITELKSWRSRFRTNDKGNPVANSVVNIELILENDNALAGKLQYNEFTSEERIKSPIKLKGLEVSQGLIEDNFTHALKSYIEKTYNFVPADKSIESAVVNNARRHSFNPLKNYLKESAAVWDGKKRLKKILPDYLGIESSEYSEKAFLALLIGAIQKVFNPREKLDFVFDFVGDTGSGKTTLLKKLFLDDQGYYTDSFQTLDKPDDFAIMQRAWCVNDDELAVSKKTGLEVIKKFASQLEVEYRKPYGRRAIRRAKGFIFVRTSNEPSHLKDETGNRRFIPLKARKEHQRYHPAAEGKHALTPDVIRQIWGEAMAEYKTVNRPHLYVELEKLAKRYQDEFTRTDSVKDIVYAVLEVPVPYDFYEYNDDQRASYVQGYLSNNGTRYTIGTISINEDDLVQRDRVRIRDLSLEGFNEPYGKNPRRDSRIRLIMDTHPEWDKRSNPSIAFGRRKDRGYIKKV